jgi:trypsin
MRFLIFTVLIATACAMDYSGPSWPRLPLDLILRGEKPIYSDDKIVGGEDVAPNSIPSQVSLQRGSGTAWSQSCGGSILGPSTILNAAHCIVGVTNFATYRIVAGEHSLSTSSGKEQNRAISKTAVHVDYISSTFENDIALIFLETPLDLSTPDVQPMELPEAGSEPASGDNLYVTGWGTTSSGGSISDTLKGVEVVYVDDATCNRDSYPGQIKPSMICAGSAGKDSCQGDSGGPLFASKGSNVQVGIVSWGRGCALPGYPGVYTQVSSFNSWIAENNKP